MLRLESALRILCALAVAVVSTFHVCDASAGSVVDVIVVSDATSGDGSSADAIVLEKCHTCAVVSLPAIVAGDGNVKIVRSIPSGPMLHTASFSQPAIGPPPRA